VRVLLPLPDRDFDPTEAAVPWRALRDAGHDVVFATERGAIPECDPRLLTGVVFGKLGASPEACGLYEQMAASPERRAPIAWESIVPRDFDALLLPGGHAPGMRQYLGSELLQRKVAEFSALDRPTGAICHGVLVLARAKDPVTGKSVLAKRRTTCLPKYLERTAYLLTFWKLGRYYRTYDAYVEDEVRAALDQPDVQFERGPWGQTERGTSTDDRPAFVVVDDRYVSARWPGDAFVFAKRLCEQLQPKD
jgi:putative intracellular protease/amidase